MQATAAPESAASGGQTRNFGPPTADFGPGLLRPPPWVDMLCYCDDGVPGVENQLAPCCRKAVRHASR